MSWIECNKAFAFARGGHHFRVRVEWNRIKLRDRGLLLHWGVRKDGDRMRKRLTMVYWKGDRFWLGKLLEYPEIMTQGETLKELEENLKDAYRLMVLDEVPLDYHTKEISV